MLRRAVRKNYQGFDEGASKLERKNAKMNSPIYREITSNDVGKALFKLNGREYPVSTFIGRILKQDIGKRVYLVGEILQVENNEQRAERLKDNGSSSGIQS